MLVQRFDQTNFHYHYYYCYYYSYYHDCFIPLFSAKKEFYYYYYYNCYCYCYAAAAITDKIAYFCEVFKSGKLKHSQTQYM